MNTDCRIKLKKGEEGEISVQKQERYWQTENSIAIEHDRTKLTGGDGQSIEELKRT